MPLLKRRPCEKLVRRDYYRDKHALYHATMEAYVGICRGQWDWAMYYNVGLIFTVVSGPRASNSGMMAGGWL